MDRSTVLVSVGQRVRDIRKQKGLSQEELGERAGFSFSYVGGVERAEKNISVTNLEKIATALDTTVAELFKYTKNVRMTHSEKDRIINKINQRLNTLTTTELKKAYIIVTELFDQKGD
jgi:transcriptional regulator with XRE-family HTH domain